MFGSEEAPEPEAPQDVDPARRMVEVQTVEIGQAFGGVIVQAEGLVPAAGYHSPALRIVSNASDGVLVLELVAEPPGGDPSGQVAGNMRALMGLTFVEDELLGRAQVIRVVAAQNALEVARVPVEDDESEEG
ncbi:MAG: hypothetical protein AAGE18_14975 [Pseudomonadota bacterium]